MGGGLMQLVAYGAQDIYLTGNPQITFFKVVYRRHTNFSMESIQQTWNGQETADGRCTSTISRNGDLVSRLFIEVNGSGASNHFNPGTSWINTVEIEIGGQMIDRQSGRFMETYYELTEPNPSGLVSDCTAANTPGTGTKFQNMSGAGGVDLDGQDVHLFVPLNFWFCRNPGLALPLIALQYHEVKVVLDHKFNTVFSAGTQTNKLWADYIYLDTDERRRFAQVSHEYLIEQVQEQTLSTDNTQTLNFNHPVKELIWTATGSSTVGDAKWTELIQPNAIGTNYHLKLNGHDRFAARDSKYFSRTQVWQYHTGPGGLNSNVSTPSGNLNDSICVYSFALKPEEHQPSGTCNFSRIDSAQIVATNVFSSNAVMFAVNYNVLRIMSGMGGLAYSN